MADPKIPGGYYIKSRKIQKSAIMNKPPCVREIWDYLLMNANHKDSILKGGKRIKRGQLLRRYEKIRDDLSWLVGWRKEMYDENQVKKAMKFLRDSLMIASTKEPGGVLITILNYDLYQDPKNYERTKDGTEERTIEEPLKNQSVPTYDKNEEELKEEEIKEGGKNDRPGNDNLVPLSYLNGDGYSQHMQDHSKEDGKGHNPFPVVNGGNGDSGNHPACEANLNGGLLDGQDTANTRTDMDAPGPSLNDDIHPGDNRGSVGDSSSRDGVDGQAPVGEDGAELDREEAIGDVNTGSNHADQRGDIRSGSSDLPDIGGGVSHGMVGMGDNRRVDTADYGGVSLPDTEVSDDKVGAPEKDENKPPPAKKKPKKKNGVVLDLSTLDPGIDTAIIEEFIAHRNGHKSQRGPFTQRMLDGVIRNAKKVSETHGGTINDALVYAMENGWLTPDPKYIDDNKARFMAFLDEQHGPLSTDKEIQKKSEDLKRRAQIAQEKWEREHGAVDA